MIAIIKKAFPSEIPEEWVEMVQIDKFCAEYPTSIDFVKGQFYTRQELNKSLELHKKGFSPYVKDAKADLEASKGRFFKVPTKEGYISAVMIANTPVLNEYGKYSNWNYIEITDSFCIIECF